MEINWKIEIISLGAEMERKTVNTNESRKTKKT
jgi:hypothetical protein